jgi:type II secretory pathway pseudopilin PulG
MNWKVKNLSVQAKLRVIAVLLSLGLGVVGTVSGVALSRTQAVTRDVVRQAAALSQLQTADMAHDEMRSNVYAALLVGQMGGLTADSVRKEARETTLSMREAMTRVAALELDRDLRAELLSSRAPIDRYLDAAEAVVTTPLGDKRSREAALTAFDNAFDEVRVLLFKQTETLTKLNQRAVERTETMRVDANLAVACTANCSSPIRARRCCSAPPHIRSPAHRVAVWSRRSRARRCGAATR